MAVYKVLGTERKCGSFEDKKGKIVDYDNIYLHCSKCNDYSKDESFGIGDAVNSFKIKNSSDVITSVFGSQLTKDDLSALIGQQVNIFFDENKNIDTIFTVPAEGA